MVLHLDNTFVPKLFDIRYSIVDKTINRHNLRIQSLNKFTIGYSIPSSIHTLFRAITWTFMFCNIPRFGRYVLIAAFVNFRWTIRFMPNTECFVELIHLTSIKISCKIVTRHLVFKMFVNKASPFCNNASKKFIPNLSLLWGYLTSVYFCN